MAKSIRFRDQFRILQPLPDDAEHRLDEPCSVVPRSLVEPERLFVEDRYSGPEHLRTVGLLVNVPSKFSRHRAPVVETSGKYFRESTVCRLPVGERRITADFLGEQLDRLACDVHEEFLKVVGKWRLIPAVVVGVENLPAAGPLDGHHEIVARMRDLGNGNAG